MRPPLALGVLLWPLLTLVATPTFAATVGPVSAVSVGTMVSPGALDPIGDGRFRVSGREYVGRMASDDPSGCFRGTMSVFEDAVLSVPHYAGTHEGRIIITSEAGTVHLSYRGAVDRFVGRGRWWVTRGTGDCAETGGLGEYQSALRAGQEPEYRLDLQGQLATTS